jgi:hypothetical protein
LSLLGYKTQKTPTTGHFEPVLESFGYFITFSLFFFSE